MANKIIIEALMISKKYVLTEIRRFLNDNIKFITTETELEKMIKKLTDTAEDLHEINKLIVLEESKK